MNESLESQDCHYYTQLLGHKVVAVEELSDAATRLTLCCRHAVKSFSAQRVKRLQRVKNETLPN